MIYKGFKSGVIIKDNEGSKKLSGVVENSADYLKFEADTLSGIEIQFHEVVDKYLDECKRIGKDPFVKPNKKV